MSEESPTLYRLRQMAQRLYDKKGFNILALDVRGVSSMTDYFLIAEGRVDRHVKALAEQVVDLLKEEGDSPVHVEGQLAGEWIVLDCWQIIVHIFGPGLRDKYQLDRLWSEGKVVDLHLTDAVDVEE